MVDWSRFVIGNQLFLNRIRKAAFFATALILLISVASLGQDNCMLPCPSSALNVPDDVNFSDFQLSSAIIPEVTPMPDGQDGEYYCMNISFGIPTFLREIPREVTGQPVAVDVEILSVQINREAFVVPPGMAVVCIKDGVIDPDCTPIEGGQEGCVRIGGIPTDPIDSFIILGTFIMRVDPLPVLPGTIFETDPLETDFTFENIVFDTIGIEAGFLPIDLNFFTAKMESGQNVIEWATSHEQSFSGFEVQRSFDGDVFTPVHFAPSAGQELGATYQYRDAASLLQPKTYYRLKMIDLDGSHAFSEVISVKHFESPESIVFPNPTTGRLYVQIGGESYQIALYNEVGQEVLRQSTGSAEVEVVEVSTISKGFYFLHLSGKDGVSVHKLVIR